MRKAKRTNVDVWLKQAEKWLHIHSPQDKEKQTAEIEQPNNTPGEL